MVSVPNYADLLVQTITFDQYMGGEYLVAVYLEPKVKYVELNDNDPPEHYPSYVLVYSFFKHESENSFKYKFNGLRVI